MTLNVVDVSLKTQHNHANFRFPMLKGALLKESSSRIQFSFSLFLKAKK